MFASVLVANRGEIAVRIMRTLREMDIRSIAVYSEADAGSLHVRVADEAVCIGPAAATDSYLSVDRIIGAARRTGAEAIHPGYGFLAENPALARACEAADIAFVGPPADVIELMGDKIRAKAAASAAGVPVVAGSREPGMDDESLLRAIEEVGRPALLKPSAGGGGKGMRVVAAGDDARELISAARREARSSFGDETLLVERYLSRPRHIEVQVLADAHGRVMHLGERECTLQRRHQKVIEEAPSAFIDDEVRAALCASAVRLAESVGYVGAGTVEYVVSGDDPRSFAFLEMNTRLQVEHPVTELTTDVDLVAWQLRIAAGQALTLAPAPLRGHAVEARIYAEDPSRGFLPTGGDVLLWHEAPGARTDAGVETGSRVGSDYDPMIAKVIVHADTRIEALDRLRAALEATVLLGVPSNIDFLRALVADGRVRAGEMDTGLLDRITFVAEDPTEGVLQAAASTLAPAPASSSDLWSAGGYWRLGGDAPIRAYVDDRLVEVSPHQGQKDRSVSSARALGSHDAWVHAPGLGTHRLSVVRPVDRQLRARDEGRGAHRWTARSPMPGSVIATLVAPGDTVGAGDPLVVVEAMKMEHTLRAPAAGIVSWVTQQSQVRLDDELVVVDLEDVS